MTELQPKDLIIGNWYHSVKFNKPVRLTATDIYDLVANADGANIDSYISGMFDPIPLTEEWLLRLGFEKITKKTRQLDVEMIWYEKSENRVWLLKNGFEFEFMCGKELCNLYQKWEHVHQLMNLFRDLTGADLVLKE